MQRRLKNLFRKQVGVEPHMDGGLVRVPLPDLSEERRKELVKVAGQYAEKSRISVRNVRRDGMDSLKMQKDNAISEDEQHRYGDDIQKKTDQFIKIDDALSAKEKTSSKSNTGLTGAKGGNAII